MVPNMCAVGRFKMFHDTHKNDIFAPLYHERQGAFLSITYRIYKSLAYLILNVKEDDNFS